MQLSLTLSLLPDVLTVCRLPADAALPEWATSSPWHSITRTTEEVSIVCLARHSPANAQQVTGWRALQVKGPLDFALIGILASLSTTLAQAGVSIFAISTYDTDYVLVQGSQLDAAILALTQAGHTVETGYN